MNKIQNIKDNYKERNLQRFVFNFNKSDIVSEREKEMLINWKNIQFWITKNAIFFQKNSSIVTSYIEPKWRFDVNYVYDKMIITMSGEELINYMKHMEEELFDNDWGCYE